MPEKDILPPRDQRATLAMVAAEAAVSLSTVSKVLNGRGGVSAATRGRVEQLLHAYGYIRRGAGSDLMPLIELVFNRIDNVWAIEIIKGAERTARFHGMGLILVQSGDLHSPGAAWIDGVMKRRPSGVILMFSDLSQAHKKQLETRNIPFVIIDPSGDPAPDVPAVGSANWTGGVLATRHLIELGHRDIAMITGPDDMSASRARVSGFQSAMDAAGIPVRKDLVRRGEFRQEDGLAEGRSLLRLSVPPTAIFAGSDLQAVGVYEAAREHGVKIPQELSVVGYDDLQICEWLGPPLTTVRQPLTEMAEQATHLVIRLSRGIQDGTTRLDLATSLVVRRSTQRIN